MTYLIKHESFKIFEALEMTVPAYICPDTAEAAQQGNWTENSDL